MPDPNPSERLAEIEARVEAATEGPLYANADDVVGGWQVSSIDKPASAIHPDEFKNGAFVAEFSREADAVFIAHARSDIPWLLEREKKLREALGCAVEELERRHPLGADPITATIIRDGRQALADSGEASGEAG